MDEEVQKGIKHKQTYFKTWQKDNNNFFFQNIIWQRKKQKRAVSEAKLNSYESLYKKLDIYIYIYELARQKKRRAETWVT